MRILLLAALLLGASVEASEPAPVGADTFAAHFYDDANVAEYFAKVDALIDAAEARIYASMEAEAEDKEPPRAWTANGILMLYTVTRTKEGVLIHFSTSRAPYLATPFGKNIVGLFMERSGWSKPAFFLMSDHRVFHASWTVPDAEFERIRDGLPKKRAQIREEKDQKAAFVRAVLKSKELE
jgi:hypothetical protein